MSKQKEKTYVISGETKGADGYRSPSEHLLDNSGDVVQTEPVDDGTFSKNSVQSEIQEARQEVEHELSLSVDKNTTLSQFFSKFRKGTHRDKNKARESSRVSRGRMTRGRSSR